jgi:hypothetical protein
MSPGRHVGGHRRRAVFMHEAKTEASVRLQHRDTSLKPDTIDVVRGDHSAGIAEPRSVDDRAGKLIGSSLQALLEFGPKISPPGCPSTSGPVPKVKLA